MYFSFLALLAIVAQLGVDTPEQLAVLFVADADGPTWAMRADFSARRGEAGLTHYRFSSVAWLSGQALASADETQASSIDGQWHSRGLEFDARAPLEGWPERDGLTVAWHSDGGLDIRLGPLLSLETDAIKPLPPFCDEVKGLSVLRATMRSQHKLRQGLAVVQMGSNGEAKRLMQAGTMLIHQRPPLQSLLLLARPSCLVLLTPGENAVPALPGHSLTWIDGIRRQDAFFPAALRLVQTHATATLLRADTNLYTLAIASTQVSAPELMPFVGDILYDNELHPVAALLLPPVDTAMLQSLPEAKQR